MPQLTENELCALAYYAIGVASEGKDEAYRLSFAGRIIHEQDGATELKPDGSGRYTVRWVGARGGFRFGLGSDHDQVNRAGQKT